MITQYPWVSVKNHERKFIEIGFMITLLVAIISFYAVPQFGQAPIYKEVYVPPPLEVYSIPATVQPPEKIMPMLPRVLVESEDDELLDDISPAIDVVMKGIVSLVPPAPPEPLDTYLEPWMVSDKPIMIGSMVVNYPEIAREAGIEGKVTITAFIGKDGQVEKAIILKGLPKTGLDDAAMTAVLQSRFTPAMQMGKPVPVKMNIPIIFRLKM